MSSRRRRAAKVSDEDLSEGEESLPAPPPQAEHSDDGSDESYYSDEEYSDEEYDEEEGYADEGHNNEEVPQQLEQTASVPQATPAQAPVASTQQVEQEAAKEGEDIEGEETEEPEEKKEEFDASRVPTAGRFFMHDDRAAAGRRKYVSYNKHHI